MTFTNCDYATTLYFLLYTTGLMHYIRPRVDIATIIVELELG